ncbi:MAG: type II secretion system F family protein [Alistipes sp.]|jgi:type IV pilus assembly protein PilC|nr:type II secretion system F family protein [Alistipes sp.]
MNDISAIVTRLSTPPVKDARKETFFSELHSLLDSGLDFSHAFRLLIEGEGGEGDDRFREILSRLYSDVVAGNSLWCALESCGRFSPLDSGVVRIGEETGRLSDALAFLVDYYHKKITQARMVSSAVSYPLIILAMALVVVVFMLAVIVPMFEQVYSRMGGELPAMTRWIISMSKRFPLYAMVGGCIAAGVGVLLYLSRDNAAVREGMSRLVLATPVAGDIVRKNSQASFCKLLFLLTSSGVPLLTGIVMLRSIIRFYPYRRSLGTIATGLEKGESLSANLEKSPRLYSRRLTTLLRVGEETGRLPQMLQKQGDDLTRELEHRLRSLANILEPALILLVGTLVAVILISMYLPMFKLGGIMG